MKKIKLLNIINLAIVIVCILVDAILGFVMKGNKNFYIATCITIISVSLVNLVFILIKEATVMMYDSKKLEPICHVFTLMIAIIAYYIVMHLDGYDTYAWLYWLGFILLIIINLIVFYLLIKKEEKKNKNANGPKFLVNK